MVKLNNVVINIIQEELEKIELKNKIELYKKNGASKSIIDILQKADNKRKWGDGMEEITKRIFGFEERDNSEHDFKTINGLKIEQKCSTMLNKDLKRGKKTYQYHAIRDNYDYDGLILMNIDFNELKYYYISKRRLMELNLFKNQKNTRIINFKSIEKYVIELTLENYDKVITK